MLSGDAFIGPEGQALKQGILIHSQPDMEPLRS